MVHWIVVLFGAFLACVTSNGTQEEFSEVLLKAWGHQHWYSKASPCSKQIKPNSVTGCLPFKSGHTFSGDECLGVKLPYQHAVPLVPNMTTLQAEKALAKYRGFEFLPGCWRHLRPLLCGLYKAPCNATVNAKLLMPHSECMNVRENCPSLMRYDRWPRELSACNNTEVITYTCGNRKDQLPPEPKWSSESTCVWPFVRSDLKEAQFIPLCGLNCTSPWITTYNHNFLGAALAAVAWSSLVLTCFAMLCHCLDSEKHVQSLELLRWPMFCYALFCLVWIVSIAFKNSIMCYPDGSLASVQHHPLCQMTSFALCWSAFGVVFWTIAHVHCAVSSAWDKIGTARHLLWAAVFVFGIVGGFSPSPDGFTGVCFPGALQPIIRLCFYIPLLFLLFLAWCLFIPMLILEFAKSRMTRTTVATVLFSGFRMRSKEPLYNPENPWTSDWVENQNQLKAKQVSSSVRCEPSSAAGMIEETAPLVTIAKANSMQQPLPEIKNIPDPSNRLSSSTTDISSNPVSRGSEEWSFAARNTEKSEISPESGIGSERGDSVLDTRNTQMNGSIVKNDIDIEKVSLVEKPADEPSEPVKKSLVPSAGPTAPPRPFELWKTLTLLLSISVSLCASLVFHFIFEVDHYRRRQDMLWDYIDCHLDSVDPDRCYFPYRTDTHWLWFQLLVLQFLPCWTLDVLVLSSVGGISPLVQRVKSLLKSKGKVPESLEMTDQRCATQTTVVEDGEGLPFSKSKASFYGKFGKRKKSSDSGSSRPNTGMSLRSGTLPGDLGRCAPSSASGHFEDVDQNVGVNAYEKALAIGREMLYQQQITLLWQKTQQLEQQLRESESKTPQESAPQQSQKSADLSDQSDADEEDSFTDPSTYDSEEEQIEAKLLLERSGPDGKEADGQSPTQAQASCSDS